MHTQDSTLSEFQAALLERAFRNGVTSGRCDLLCYKHPTIMAKAKAAKTATPQSKGSKKDTKVKQAAVKAETKTKIVKVRCSS